MFAIMQRPDWFSRIDVAENPQKSAVICRFRCPDGILGWRWRVRYTTFRALARRLLDHFDAREASGIDSHRIATYQGDTPRE
jgi:hypothetical protein